MQKFMRCSKGISKFMLINNQNKKKERSQINNLTLHLKELEKEQPMLKLVKKKKKEINETEIKDNYKDQ